MKKKVKCFIQHRYTKFILGGNIVFLFEWLLTIMLTELFYFHHNLSYIFSLLLGLLLLFSFHEKITFRADTTHRYYVLKKFVWLYSMFAVINWFLVYLISPWINYIILIPIVTAILSAVIYPLNKNWIFRCKS
jgi:putative flippase GtrA